MNESVTYDSTQGMDIAIVGMAGRFPGARNLDEFWQNLRDGVESISFFTDEDLRAEGVDTAELNEPHYVKAGGMLEGVEWFDAPFFGFYPREAEIMDPQHRVFLECAWEALEHAGYTPETYPGLIGVYAGASMNTYLLFNLLTNREIRESVHPYQLTLGNDKDFLPTRVSYKLNLKGPSLNIQTACSTSLVAIHLACQSLISFQCDMALAGGVAIRLPQKRGYLYQEGGIASPDGHCRAFDAKANGTVSGSGVGIVVLKRLADALADGDMIHAVIKGSAINNDGSLKVGYTAPSVDGQADVIAAAQTLAGIEPETISYIEAHGTGTAMGDPIEIAALKQVFQDSIQAPHSCAIGSLKTNIGHLDAAAGVASLLKTVLALKHKTLPPSLHFEQPNPKIDFDKSPFFVNTTLAEWKAPRDGMPRRAGVSSFGIGGTNAHVVVEEAPITEAESSTRSWQLLVLSARSDSALDTATANLADHLRRRQQTDLNLADAAYTLQVGRQTFNHRRSVVCRDRAEAMEALETLDPRRIFTASQEPGAQSVAFMFTGQGSQYVNMALELYEAEPTFREQIDLCCQLLEPYLGFDLRDVLYPPTAKASEAERQLEQTFITQPSLFAVEYALAQLWIEWGIKPEAMIGHSIGEYVAACLAGVFSLQDALSLVAARGRMMQQMPTGSMLSVPLAEQELLPFLDKRLSLAAVNAPALCVVSGPADAIDEMERRLAAQGVECRRLHTSHAFHSEMMDPILDGFADRVGAVDLKPPAIPFVSNVTGTWITAEEATDPGYWARHLRQTVRFADGVGELLSATTRVLLEVGPGKTLGTLAKWHPAAAGNRVVLTSLRHPQDPQPDMAFLLTTLGKLWLAGIQIDWHGFHAHEQRRRVPLPTYPFERQRYWVEAHGSPYPISDRPPHEAIHKRANLSSWFYVPSWKRVNRPHNLQRNGSADLASRWLVFSECDLGSQLVDRLGNSGRDVTAVRIGTKFEVVDDRTYFVNPRQRADYEALFRDLVAQDRIPDTIVHVWGAQSISRVLHSPQSFDEAQDLGFYSLLFLTQTLGAQNITQPLQIGVVSANAQEVTGDEELVPERATALGLCSVISQEYPNITCRSIDVTPTISGTPQREKLIDKLMDELEARSRELTVAYRGQYRWAQTFEAIQTDDADPPTVRLREGGAYLITGGLGRIGLTFAGYLAKTVHARLVLVDRSALPARGEWEDWLASHDPQDGVSRKIHSLRMLETLGAEILVISADVADRDHMQNAVKLACEQFGALHGVIHAAGLVGEQSIRTIQEADTAQAESQFGPKVRGLLTLEEVLHGQTLDFCLLQSSLSSILGGLGFAAYAAANRFMDAFAHTHNRGDYAPWISVNWDGWNFGETKELGATSAHNGRGQALGMATAEWTLTPEEGVEAFQRILSLGEVTQVVVSTADLQARIDRWVKLEPTPDERLEEIASMSLRHPRPNVQTAYVAARNEIEQAIVTTWQKVLGIDSIGVYDDFFELGGHSLLATQLVSRLRDTFHVELPLRKLFETPTAAGLAELIRVAQPSTTDPTTPSTLAGIQPVSREGELPLSFGQQRLWFLDQLDPGSSLYNNLAAVRLTGSLDVSILRRCLNEIVRRHEVLRTTFHEAGGRPKQVILPELALELPVMDLRDLPRTERETWVKELALQEGRKSFDLRSGSLMRMTLLQMDSEEYVALMTMHHIVSDGWSVGVFIQETAALYEAFSAGKPSPLPDLRIQYVDYAHWQSRRLQGEGGGGKPSPLEDQLSYWKQQLGDNPPALDLPTDRPRPAVQTSHGANHWFDLPEGLARKLDDLSQQAGTTLFMTLLAALQTLLHRYTGQEDICIGTPIANRNRSETETLIGFLLNTLVLRADLSGNPTFRELLARVREVALGAYAHPDLPFETLVEALQPKRDMSRSPLFQVMFDLQMAPLEALQLSSLTFSPLRVDNGTAKFDLAIGIEQGKNGLSGYVNYNTDLFDRMTIERMVGHFQTLLASVVADPDQPIGTLQLLTQAEQRQLLVEWNDTATADEPAPYVHHLMEAQVERTPDAIAVVFGKEQLTYQDLNHRANQVAHYLRKMGVGPEVIVGLCVERSLEVVVGLLGILKAGGVYLPLDPSYPAERLAFMLNDSKAHAVLTQVRLLPGLPQHAAKTVCVDRDWASISQEPADNPDAQTATHNAAYIIYTSGSTGQPKGVVIPHEAIANHCRDIRRHFQLEPSDNVLQFASLNFDPSLEQILTTLIVGARLVLRDSEVWSARDFHRNIARYGLTVVNTAPAYWQQWVQECSKAADWEANEQLRLVIAGGDVVLPESVRLWHQTPMRSARLLNAYGPTETTITAATFEVPDYLPEGLTRIPIGRPLANRTMYILDRHGNPTPIGVPGELHIGGAGLARGYLDRPQLTAEKFISDPFCDTPGARLYRTGDLARYLPNGDIEFLGRIDQQVKIRGIRVELGEIESVLGRHPGVQDVAVIAREDIPGDRRLVAYVVPGSNADPAPTPAGLRVFLKENLPDHMVPSAFVLLTELPQTPSGKVDRRALPAPDGSQRNGDHTYAAPRTPLEEELASIWSKVLGVERVGVDDNFFDLGGHSLMATQLMSRLRESYQVDLPLRRLFETPTVAGLATTIAQSLAELQDEEEIAQMLAELEQLSDAEAKEMLTGDVTR